MQRCPTEWRNQVHSFCNDAKSCRISLRLGMYIMSNLVYEQVYHPEHTHHLATALLRA